jgi:hydrogenase small subunit
MGCKGPVAFQNCPVVRWNDGTNWPVGCGHPCIGCAAPGFWDRMTPFYQHLPGVPGFGVGSDVDKAGAILAGGAAAAFVGHGLVQLGRRTIFKNLVFRGDPSIQARQQPPPGKEGGAQ